MKPLYWLGAWLFLSTPVLASEAELWGAVGPGWLASNANHFALRIAAGGDVSVGRGFRLGSFLVKPWSEERLTGPKASGVNRWALYPSLRYVVVPEALWVRAGLGLAYLTSDHGEVLAKLKPTYHLGAGAWLLDLGEGFRMGAEISLEHTGTARNSVSLLPDSLGNAFGDPDPTGTIPKANLLALSLVLSWSP